MAEEQQDAIKLHDLRPAKGSNKPKLRYGRGESGKGGKTATRGTKGTRARNTVPAGFEGGQLPLHMRLPKLRGFRNPAKVEFQVVNLDKLTEAFPTGQRYSCRTRGPVRRTNRSGLGLGRHLSGHQYYR